jgi:ribosomal protein S18 acetylase RimI-like enzyme
MAAATDPAGRTRMPDIQLLSATTADELDAVRGLIWEYAQGLGVDLCFQDFEGEVARLPGAYAAPGGGLLVVRVDGQWAGCGAFRPLAQGHDGARACEMKRLYVRDAFRGLHLGRRLAQALMAGAAGAGYEAMLLDTLAPMRAARALYASLGFVAVPPYYLNPLADTLYLKADLRGLAARPCA